MREKNNSMGEPALRSTVNGTEVLSEGKIATRRLQNNVQTPVCCVSCKYHRTSTVPDACICKAIITDEGHNLTVPNKHTTRCQQWRPHPRLLKVGTSSGKVDHPNFVKWKLLHPEILENPKEHGQLPEESLHDFLMRKWKNRSTPIS